MTGSKKVWEGCTRMLRLRPTLLLLLALSALGGFAAGCGGDSPSAVSVTVTVTTQASTDATETSAESATDTRASDETAPPEETFTDDGTDTSAAAPVETGPPSSQFEYTTKRGYVYDITVAIGKPDLVSQLGDPGRISLYYGIGTVTVKVANATESRDAPLADGGDAPLYVTLYQRVPAAAGVDDDIVPQLGCDPSASSVTRCSATSSTCPRRRSRSAARSS